MVDVDVVVRSGVDEIPVTLTVAPEATGDDVSRALADLLGAAPAELSVTTTVGGPPQPLGGSAPVRLADLPSGATVHVGPPTTTVALPAGPGPAVEVAGGLHAGPGHPLGAGSVSVGRGRSAICDCPTPR